VSWEKRTIPTKSSETDKIEQVHRTYWTIEAPRWDKPKGLFEYNVSDTELYMQILMWLGPEE
jgi:hypothetical protein